MTWHTRATAVLVLAACLRPATAAPLEFTPVPLDAIEPGTVIGAEAPQGWTHLIVKNKPRVEGDDAAKVIALAADLAGSIFSAITANVARPPDDPDASFELAAIGAGIGTAIDGHDTVVTKDNYQDFGPELGFMVGAALSQTEAVIGDWKIVARGPRCAVVDAPTLVHWDGAHRQLVMRYFLVVEPDSGALATFVCLLKPNADASSQELVERPLVRLDSGYTHAYPLLIDSDEVTFGVPTAKAFAMGKLPEGAYIDWMVAPRALAAELRWTEALLGDAHREFSRLITIPGRAP